MTAPSRLDLVRTLLTEYARRTGLDGDSAAPRRYLWTDAFAVCTCLGLARATGDDAWLERALRLVDQVHATLGRHRADDPREGWLSGLSEEEGRAHPTRGGLRIGKPAPERGLGEPLDPRREWDRDGQYFHYATKWMHALAQVARATGEARYLEQAIELARATCTGFTLRSPTGEPRLAWKMSVDLSRPQVPSTGQHDALDGWLTLRCLRADARRAGRSAAAASLAGPIEELRALDAGASWATADALGIGGLLCDALRASRLAARDGDGDEEGEGNGAATMLGPRLLDAAALGLAALVPTDALRGPAARRLAFRELGLATLCCAALALGLWLLSPALVMLPNLMHGNPGFQQVGYRFILDALPVLWLMLGLAFRESMSRATRPTRPRFGRAWSACAPTSRSRPTWRRSGSSPRTARPTPGSSTRTSTR